MMVMPRLRAIRPVLVEDGVHMGECEVSAESTANVEVDPDAREAHRATEK
jgi:hypothetical protein